MPGAVQMYKQNRERTGSKPETKNDSIKLKHGLKVERERETGNGVNISTSSKSRHS